MTDEEERKELMADLGQVCLDTHTTREVCLRAAEEIERLAEENKKLANHCEHLRTDVIRLGKENKELKKNLHHMSSARESDMGSAE